MQEADRKMELRGFVPKLVNRFRTTIATRLTLSFLLVILMTSIIFTITGIQLIGNRIVTEAQETVKRDLNSAREIYDGKLRQVNDVVRLTADRYIIITALKNGKIADAAVELLRIKANENLDMLTITDTSGIVLIRASNWEVAGDNQSGDDLVASVLHAREPVAATSIVQREELQKESLLLVKQAYLRFTDTPMARTRIETEQTSGMMLKAAAPIFDREGNFLGVVYGGVLLNKNYDIVDEIKRTVFQELKYKGDDIGTATIFQDDVRISTNVMNENGSRAIGTRIMQEVYDRVIVNGQPWVDRAYVVNNWYITAYGPIENINGQRIGILYVGILEKKYTDTKKDIILAFVTITLLGVLVTMIISYFISQRISIPIRKLAAASREIADGNLDAKVEIKSSDELGRLAYNFNRMGATLKERDEQLKEFTRKKIMESERLALIGQLSANVAHELNNPLQGIVTYSHLLLENKSQEDEESESLQKIVIQANRCRDIIRGLLDFSRQRKPDKTLCDINDVLKGCVSLLERQAQFHNIQIIWDLRSDLPKAVIDPSQIERVFINLIINAADAMANNGKLTLSTNHDSLEGCIEISFGDTGHGISKENLEKIFDPFFTTKDTGHGVGLGLAISYGIIKEHNGMISVESEEGKGTTFTVRLPVTVEESVSNG